jgi:hypothetical protein
MMIAVAIGYWELVRRCESTKAFVKLYLAGLCKEMRFLEQTVFADAELGLTRLNGGNGCDPNASLVAPKKSERL